MERVKRVLVAGVVAAALVLVPGANAATFDKLVGGLGALARDGRVTADGPEPLVQPPPPIVRGGQVLVDVHVGGALRDAAAALRREGMRVEAVSRTEPERMVEGWLPLSALDDVAALRSTRAVAPVVEPVFNTGGTLSEGDAVHRGPQARALGPAGAGIPVGVISDSINKVGGGVAGSQGTGDLPASVQILDDSNGLGTDEGRALAEIVYDTAPGIPSILFTRGGPGAAGKAAGIDALVAAGAKVIVDDVAIFSEPFFQDGVVAQAVDRAKAADVAYVASAGNRARQAWDGVFTPVGALNDFDPGAGSDTRQTVATVPDSQQLSLFVQWDDPVGAVTNDFALDFYNATTSAFIGTINSNNVTSGIPTESGILTGAGGGTTFALEIRRMAGTGTPHLRWIANGTFSGSLPAELATNSSAIDPDAASARGSITVGAVRHSDAGLDTVESFSSRGPFVTHYLDASGARLATPELRAKPDVAAADGVATSLPSGPLNPFFGTTASAGSAGGVVALLRSAKPSLSVDLIYAILRDPRGSVRCVSATPAADCGSGFLLADGKLAMVLDSTPPVVSAVLSPGAPNGANGWYVGDVTLAWNVSDPNAPLTSSGCDPQSITTDQVVAFSCSAVSPGGTTNQPVTIKRDASPPTKPVIRGIRARRYTPRTIPRKRAISCRASDPTSSVRRCVISGFKAAPGRHRLTARATNRAGLSSVRRLTYTGRGPVAAGRLKLARRIKRAALLDEGLPVRVKIGGRKTKLTATLLAATGPGRKTTRVGRLRTTVGRGAARLTVKLSAAGRRLLANRRTTRLTLTVKASARNAFPAELKKSSTAGA